MNASKTKRHKDDDIIPNVQPTQYVVHEHVAIKEDIPRGITSPNMPGDKMSEFYTTYSVQVGLNTAFVLGGILFVTVMYLLYKTKCRKPLRRQFRKVLVYVKGAPPPKAMDTKCVGTTIQMEPTKGSWICFDNPDIAPSVEIDALKATALWIMQNHEDELQNLHEVSGIILRVDPDVIHASAAKEKATWLGDNPIFTMASTPMSNDSLYDSVPRLLQVPVDNHLLQVPNICVETPRPSSTLSSSPNPSPISFTRQNRLHNSSSHPGFDSSSWSAQLSPLCFDEQQTTQFFSQPSLPVTSTDHINRVNYITKNYKIPIPINPIVTDTNHHQPIADSNSDSQTEDDPLLQTSARIHRYDDDISHDMSNNSRISSHQSNQSYRSSQKTKHSPKVKAKHERLLELRPTNVSYGDGSSPRVLVESTNTNNANLISETNL